MSLTGQLKNALGAASLLFVTSKRAIRRAADARAWRVHTEGGEGVDPSLCWGATVVLDPLTSPCTNVVTWTRGPGLP